MPMGDFTKTTPSVGALTTGLAMSVVADITKLESYNYEVKTAVLNTEGLAAQGLGEALQSAMQNEGNTAEFNGWASVGMGATQITGEVGSSVWDWRTSLNHDIQMKTETLSNIDSWDKALQKTNGSKLELEEVNENLLSPEEQQAAEQQRLAQAETKLKKANVEKEAYKDEYQSDLEFAQAKNSKVVDDLRDETRRSEKRVRKEKEALETRKESFRSRISNLLQSGGYITQGALQVRAASFKFDEANDQLLSKEAEYTLDNTKNTVNSSNSLGDGMEGNKNAAVQALLAGIARANEVQV